VQVPSPYYRAGHERRVGIVIHTMVGSLSSCDRWFASNPFQVSSHYGVGLEGEAHQYVSLDNSAHANGVLEPGNLLAPRFGSDWPNDETIQIETEDRGLASTPVTDAMYATTLALCRRAIAAGNGGVEVVTGHYAISPQNKARCPGARWVQSGRLAQLATDLGLELL